MSRPPSISPKRWELAPAAPAELRQALGHLHPVLVQILNNRGLVEPAAIQAFIEGHYLLPTDPFLLPDMETAVERVAAAVKNEETIIVYGDFDADGVTATVLLVEALRGLGLPRERAQPYIPSRVDEGYGLNAEALTYLRETRGADLVITVDCGIRAVHEVAHANELGLDMIVTDHHSLGPHLPPALAVINPKRPESTYPEKMLAGVGIAYKLAQALEQRLGLNGHGAATGQLLDLVAIGTVADVAPLLGENRRLVSEGLAVLNAGRRPGVAALSRVSRVPAGQISAESIGFALGPRINAAGRLAHAYDAARLLAASDPREADALAQSLNRLNQRRQSLTAELNRRAEAMIEPGAPILVAADPTFEAGIVGLVASRLAERHYRPAIVIEQGETESRGSCRSIPEFHITAALDQVSDLLTRYGGHAEAAGFTLDNENLAAFQEQITAVASAELDDAELLPTITADVEITLADIDWALHEQLAQLEPTGEANETPLFISRGVEIVSHRAVGQEGAHLRLQVSDGQREFGAIAFRQGAWAARMPANVDLLYNLGVNEWRGNRTLQLVVRDLREATV